MIFLEFSHSIRPDKLNLYGFIYCVINKINNKKYIGQTIQSINKRWISHCNDKNYDKMNLPKAILKYGKDNFIIGIIAVAKDKNELNLLEIELIEKYDSINTGYNISKGGHVRNCSKEIEEKRITNLRSKLKSIDRTNSLNALYKSTQVRKGIPVSQEMREHLSKISVRKSVICKNLLTSEEFHFSSLKEASNVLKLNYRCLSRVARKKRSHHKNWVIDFKE